MPNNEKKYASLSTLQTFLSNLRTTFSSLGHKHTISDMTDYKVDTSLSSTSTNPVQNAVLNAEFDSIATAMNALDLAIDGKADASDVENIQTALDNKSDIDHTHSYDDLRNKPFYEGTDYSSVLTNGSSTVNFYDWGSGVYGAAVTNVPKVLTQNVSCKVIWDGREYTMTSAYAGNNESGNPITSLGAPYGDYSNYPFGIDSYQTASGTYEFSIHTDSTASTHTIDILEFGSKFVTLDDRFISDNIARTIDVDTKLASKSDTTHNHDSAYDTLGAAAESLASAKSYTDTKVANLASTSIVDTKISTHNTSTTAHNDIRDLITGLTTRLNTLADSDDTTLDQLSEIVTYIKNNKSLIDGITTSKVNVTDIVNNLTTNVTNKPLSAAQGVAIQTLIDTLQEELDSHTHGISEVTGLQSALDSKAASSHGTHVSYSTTAPVMDGTASVGTASTVARSDHKHPTDTSRASKSEFDNHTSDTTKHITSTERTNWNTAATNVVTAQTRADSAYDLANNAMPKSGGQFTGSVTIGSGKVLDFVTMGGKLRILGGGSTDTASIRLVDSGNHVIEDILQVNVNTGELTGGNLKTALDEKANLTDIVTEEAVILPPTTLTVNVTQGDGKFSTFGSDYAYNQELVVGGIYEVEYDGKKYTCTAVDSLSYNNTTYQYTACLGGINEGYPFIIGSNSRRTALAGLLTTGESVAATQAGTATHTISISIPRTINPELIPTTLATKDYVNASVDTKANAIHNHEISDVTDLQTTLDTMQESINSIPQSNWNQNNSAQLDYIKNRTHWVEQNFTPILSERSISNGTSITELKNINAPDSCIVTLDGVQYQCDMWVNETGEYCFGDSRIVTRYDWDLGTEVIDTSHPENTPFYISVCGEDDIVNMTTTYDWYVMFNSSIANTAHTISIGASTGEGIYHPLDERFLPSSVARTSVVNAISDDLNETQLQVDTKASVVTLTTAEYEALVTDGINANTLYMITDAEEEVVPQIQIITWGADD